MSKILSSRAHAVSILDCFDKKELKLSTIYEEYFDSSRVLKKHRPEVTYLVQEVIRQRAYLDYIISFLFKGNFQSTESTLKNTLRLGVYEILFRDHVPDFAAVNEAVSLIKRRRGKGPAGLTNALLRKVRKSVDLMTEKPSLSISIAKSSALLSHPEWLVKRWVDFFGWEKTEKLCKWNNQSPTLSIRMNSLKTNHTQLEDFLIKEDVIWKKNESYPEFYFITQTSKLRDSNQFKQGHFSFQDVSSGFIAALLKPKEGDTVLDVCAAPGGKACALAEKMKDRGIIYAYDSNLERVNLLKETVMRLGLDSISCGKKDATIDNFPKASHVLVDAPCTGTGVMSKRADLRWRRKKTDVHELVLLQKKILSHCANFLQPDGELVYATCSIEPEENWGVIDQFLENNPDFSTIHASTRIPERFVDKRGALSTFPPEHGTDGVFGVILKKFS